METQADLLLHDPRIALIHGWEPPDVRMMIDILKHPSNASMDPEVVLPRRNLGDTHPLAPFLYDNNWMYSDISAAGGPATYADLALEMALYATHVIIFWDGKNDWVKVPMDDPRLKDKPLKLIRV